MSENTAISWTHHTFNPWSGCVKISEACANCYAANMAPSYRRGADWGKDTPRIAAGEAYWQKPLAWNKAAAASGEQVRVFCASMADVFEDRADLEAPRLRLWKLIKDTPHLTWLLLTKRPEKMAAWAEAHGWPVNAWAGVSVETQRRAEERIPHLLRVPATVRFLSMEPLRGPVDLAIPWEGGTLNPLSGICIYASNGYITGCPQIHWIVAGGESGAHARPMAAEWVRDIRDACTRAGVPFHFKQWGELIPASQVQHLPPEIRDRTALRVVEAYGEAHIRYGKADTGRLLDGELWDEFPM